MRTVSNMESGTPSVNNRSVEAVDALGVPLPMRQAAVELIASYDYEKAAWRAGVTADVVRGWAEVNQSPDWLTPLDEDAAMDFLFSCVAGWIIMREPVPIDSKERMTQIFESMINALRKIQSSMPEDEANLKRGLLHLLRRQFIVRKGDSQS